MFVVLHLADFALQAVLRTACDFAATASAPAALFTSNTKKSLVLALNETARAAGVTLGMTAPQALARCGALQIHTAQPDTETDAHAVLLAVGFTVSPSVELTASGVCTVGATGLTSVKLPQLAEAARARLGALGLAATAGIAPTPLLALYAARATTTVRVVATAEEFLPPLPLATIEPRAELAEILHAWGLRTLGDLTALARDDIGRRLGPEGLTLWDRARGGAARPLHLVAPPQTFFATKEFEEEISALEPLLFLLRRFLDRLVLELQAAGVVAAELELTLQLADDTAYQRSFRLPEPTGDAALLFRVLHTHLETLHTDTAIGGFTLRALPVRPLVRQAGLFETGLRDPHGFTETLARVASIVGADRVGTPQLADTHRPDAVSVTPPPSLVPPADTREPHAPLGLPLRRFRPTLAARLELTEGRPSYVWTERMEGAIAAHRGPWQSSGDWWQTDRAWRRAEWDIALAQGGAYRLLRVEQSWFIEGEYD